MSPGQRASVSQKRAQTMILFILLAVVLLGVGGGIGLYLYENEPDILSDIFRKSTKTLM